jgi:hypothetical protein
MENLKKQKKWIEAVAIGKLDSKLMNKSQKHKINTEDTEKGKINLNHVK